VQGVSPLFGSYIHSTPNTFFLQGFLNYFLKR